MPRVGHPWLRVARAGGGPPRQVRRLEVDEPEAHGLLAVEDLVARLPRERGRQVEVTAFQTRVETVNEIRDGTAEERPVRVGDGAVAVDVDEPQVARFLPALLGEAESIGRGLEHPRHLEAPEAADGLTDDCPRGECHFVAKATAQDFGLALSQRQYLVADR